MSNLIPAQHQQVSGLKNLVKEYLPLFSLSMLGLVAIRIWLQCCVYDRYASTDSGIVTIISNLFRVAVIIVLIIIGIKRGFSPTAQARMGYLSILAMMLAAALFLVFDQTGQIAILWAACLLAGFGIAWGGGMWICVYVRMQPGEALLYAFLSLAISSFIGFFLGALSLEVAHLIAIFMPPIALIAYQRAQKNLDEREQKGDSLHVRGVVDSGPDDIYDTEPKETFLRLIVGIVLFNLALGIARGYPYGASIGLPVLFQALHQFSVVGVCLILIWWALGKKRSIKFSSLWNVSVAAIAIGVLILAMHDSRLESLGATSIAIANTFSIGLLWFSIYDFSRHSRRYKSYIVLGVVWVAHLLPRELGRLAIWEIGPQGDAPVLIMAFVVFLLAGSMALLLNDSIPRNRTFFREFRRGFISRSFRNRVVAIVDSTDNPRPEDVAHRASEAAPETDTLEADLASVKDRYGLTERELEVVRHLAKGRNKTYISKKLYISENTVKSYVKKIYAKLDIHSKQELLDCLEDAADLP